MNMHIRTEDGVATRITTHEALSEMNAAIGGSLRKKVRNMSARGGSADIEYKDGRKVRLRPAPAEEITPAETLEERPESTVDGRRIVTVKGKRYVVSSVRPHSPWTPGCRTWNTGAHVSYWAERDGRTFGPTYSASATSKAGTIGAGIWAVAQ